MALNNEKFKAICPDNWVAQAYGEYLADCAAQQADLLSAYTEISANDAIDDMIDSLSDAYTAADESIKSDVLLSLVEVGVADVNNISYDSEEYVRAFRLKYSHDHAFKEKVDELHVQFPSVPAVTAEFSAAQLAEWLASHPVDYIISQDTSILSAIEHEVDGYLAEKSIQPTAPLTFNSGYAGIKAVLTQLVLHTSIDDSIPMDLSFTDEVGNPISLDMTPSEIIEEIKTNFASCTAWSQGFLAMTRDNVTEAIAAFEAGIGTIISNAQEKFAATVAQVKATISETRANVGSFLEACDSYFGFSQIRDDTFTTVDETDIFAYTGASPLAGINLKTVQGVAVATGKAVAAIGVAIWAGVRKIAGKIWKKVAPIVKAITNNPIDIEISDSNDKRYSMSNFYYQGRSKKFDFGFSSNNPAYDYYPTSEQFKWIDLLSKLIGEWYSVDTYFYSFSFKLLPGATCVISSDHRSMRLTNIEFDFKLKPKCINVELAQSFGLIEQVNRTVGFASVNLTVAKTGASSRWDSLEDFMQTNDMYFDDVSAENKMQAGFLVSLILGLEAMKCAYDDLGYSFDQAYDYHISNAYGFFKSAVNAVNHTPSCNMLTWDSSIDIYDNQVTMGLSSSSTMLFNSLWFHNQHYSDTWNYPYNEVVTNEDFIVAACGPIVYDIASPTTQKEQDAVDLKFANVCGYAVNGSSNPEESVFNVCICIIPFLAAFLLQQYDKQYHPTDYVFLPYCKNSYSFYEGGRYHIKTDAQNRNIAQVMVNAIVAIAVIIAAVLICKGILKIFKLKKISKLQSRVGVMDQSIWNGGKLSLTQQARYRRYSKKLDRLTGASTGLAGSATSTSLIGKAVTTIKDQVLSNVDVPASIASGAVVTKQVDTVEDVNESVVALQRLIAG